MYNIISKTGGGLHNPAPVCVIILDYISNGDEYCSMHITFMSTTSFAIALAGVANTGTAQSVIKAIAVNIKSLHAFLVFMFYSVPPSSMS